jgi:integrase
MATFKAAIFKQRIKVDNTFDVKIRVSHIGIKRYVTTPFNVTLKDITPKSLDPKEELKFRNHQIEDDVNVIIKRYRKICNELGERINNMDVDQLVDHLVNYQDRSRGFQLDFFKYSNIVVDDLNSNGKKGSAGCYAAMVSSLKTYTGREELSIFEITVKFLQDYVKWLDARAVERKQPKGGRALSYYCTYIRAVYNKAMKSYNKPALGMLNIPYSPFDDPEFEFPEEPAPKKRNVSSEIIQEIASLPYIMPHQPGTCRFNLAKDVFMLSFCLLGINTVDLYTCDTLKKGWITYDRSKTKDRRKDNATISVLIQPEIKLLVEKYKDPTGQRVFNFYLLYTSFEIFNTAVNKGLKEIGTLDSIKKTDLQFYAARHSWATIALNKAGVDKYTVHMALDHVDKEMKVTDIYIENDFSIINNANRKVLDYLKMAIDPTPEPKFILKRYTTL